MFPKVSFLVALLVVTGLVAACSAESSDPVVVSPEEVAAATTPDSTPQVLVVVKVLDPANAGDYGEWIIHFSPDAVIPLATLADVSAQDHFEFEAAIQTQRAVTTPCQMVSGSVRCGLRVENDLLQRPVSPPSWPPTPSLTPAIIL